MYNLSLFGVFIFVATFFQGLVWPFSLMTNLITLVRMLYVSHTTINGRLTLQLRCLHEQCC